VLLAVFSDIHGNRQAFEACLKVARARGAERFILLGDFVGGGAVVIAAKSILQSSYTREAETAADAYGAGLMNKAGGDARALAVILDKIGGATEPGMKILLDHPETKARVAAINRLATTQAPSAFLDPAEWSALKQICGS